MVGKTTKLKKSTYKTSTILIKKKMQNMNGISDIKIEAPEFVGVNSSTNVWTTVPVDANISIKEEPIDSLQPFTFCSAQYYSENYCDEGNDDPGITCGKVIMYRIDDDVTTYKLRCTLCKSIFTSIADNIWHQFITHLAKNHGRKENSTDKHNKNHQPEIDIETTSTSKHTVDSLLLVENIDESLKKTVNNIGTVLNHVNQTDGKNNINDRDTDEENNNKEVNYNNSNSDESEHSVDECYVPKNKKIYKASKLNNSYIIQSASKAKCEKILSFNHPNKEYVIAFLELLKTHAILWHPRQRIMKLADKAIATVNMDFNKRFPNYALTKDEVRQSIKRIKDMYSRGSNETIKRNTKSHVYKTKHPKYFELCAAIEENSESIKQKCTTCNEIFYNTIDLQIHKVKRHRIGELPFKCKSCGYGFTCPEKLANHEEKHDRVKSFNCELCNQSFYFENKLQAHMVLHTDDSKLICEICGKKFPTHSEYRRHKLHHEEPKEKCEICGKYYFEKRALSEHMKSHRNERHYKCDICGKSFNRQGSVRIHKRGVHKTKLQTKRTLWTSRVQSSSNVEIKKRYATLEQLDKELNSNSNSSSWSSASNEQNAVEINQEISNNQQIFPLEMLNSLMN